MLGKRPFYKGKTPRIRVRAVAGQLANHFDRQAMAGLNRKPFVKQNDHEIIEGVLVKVA
jgi:hypothetical protein